MNNFKLSESITIFTNGLPAFYVDHATCNDPSPQTISKLYLNSIKFP